MRVLKLTVAYDGGAYVGWQRQADGTSIQGLIEEALARIEGQSVTVTGAGRTDAGVHALGQVASVRVETTHGADTYVRALNAALPEDVRVRRVEVMPETFHARFDARAKTYRYRILAGPIASPFELRYAWHVTFPSIARPCGSRWRRAWASMTSPPSKQPAASSAARCGRSIGRRWRRRGVMSIRRRRC